MRTKLLLAWSAYCCHYIGANDFDVMKAARSIRFHGTPRLCATKVPISVASMWVKPEDIHSSIHPVIWKCACWKVPSRTVIYACEFASDIGTVAVSGRIYCTLLVVLWEKPLDTIEFTLCVWRREIYRIVQNSLADNNVTVQCEMCVLNTASTLRKRPGKVSNHRCFQYGTAHWKGIMNFEKSKGLSPSRPKKGEHVVSCRSGPLPFVWEILDWH